jgi:hypothetical protein
MMEEAFLDVFSKDEFDLFKFSRILKIEGFKKSQTNFFQEKIFGTKYKNL